MVKVLSMGDNPKTSTGYGQVWDNLLTRFCKLKPDWEFYHIGWQSQDRPHKRIEGYTMLPMGRLEYGFDALDEQIKKLNPDIVITLADIGWQAGYINVVHEAKKNGWKGRWLAYFPIDTEGWAMTWDEVFKAPDVNIAMAEFGAGQMRKHNVQNIVCIPHGVDINIFKPLENKQEIKAKYGLKDKFVVGYVGRNQRRKMVDRLLHSFAQFAEGKEDVVLMAHTDEEPPKDGWSMPYNLWQFKIADKVRLTKSKMDIVMRQKIQPENMNEIYNMMDVFLYTTGGEGFGLPGIECQSAGVPLAMNDTTTAWDFCKKENRIPILKDTHGRDMIDRGTNGVYFKYPDDVEAAKILEKHYKDWKESNQQEAKEAREQALLYDWDKIVPLWIDLFEKNL